MTIIHANVSKDHWRISHYPTPSHPNHTCSIRCVESPNHLFANTAEKPESSARAACTVEPLDETPDFISA